MSTVYKDWNLATSSCCIWSSVYSWTASWVWWQGMNGRGRAVAQARANCSLTGDGICSSHTDFFRGHRSWQAHVLSVLVQDKWWVRQNWPEKSTTQCRRNRAKAVCSFRSQNLECTISSPLKQGWGLTVAAICTVQ